MFDCIIVGAGPAGGAAAYHLAKQGRSVLVLEKEKLPRQKPCAGGVSPIIAQWFDFDFAPVVVNKVNAIRYTWKLEDPVEAKMKVAEPMWMVQRDQFDLFLMQQAQQQGAELRDNTAVTGIEFKGDHWQVNTTAEPVTGRYLIAADGAKGPMAKWLGFKEHKTRTGVSLEVETGEAQNQSPAQFEFGMIKNGFIWNFPKAGGYSIGAATFRADEPRNLSQLVVEYAQKLGLQVTSSPQEYPICLWDGHQKLHAQNAVLAGEAAAILDPFTAEGIRPSIFSGVKAAGAIDRALSGDSAALEGYTKIMKDEWGEDMVWAQRLAGVFYRVPGIGYKVGIKRPSATERVGQIMCGELRYADVANRALKRLSSGLIPGMGS